MIPTIPSVVVVEDSVIVVMARAIAVDGDPVQQADLTALAWTSFDVSGNSVVLADQSLTISSVIYDTLQTTDSLWDADSTGYNFKTTIPATAFPTGKNDYSLRIKFTDTGSNVWNAPIRVRTHQAYNT